MKYFKINQIMTLKITHDQRLINKTKNLIKVLISTLDTWQFSILATDSRFQSGLKMYWVFKHRRNVFLDIAWALHQCKDVLKSLTGFLPGLVATPHTCHTTKVHAAYYRHMTPLPQITEGKERRWWKTSWLLKRMRLLQFVRSWGLYQMTREIRQSSKPCVIFA